MLAERAFAMGARARAALRDARGAAARALRPRGRARGRRAAAVAGIVVHAGTTPSSSSTDTCASRPAARTSRSTGSSRCRASKARRSPGCPRTRDGFLVTDAHARVRGVPDVYAAGDVTAFPIKQGGIACQQADAAAEHIAARAGAPVEPTRSRPCCAACC